MLHRDSASFLHSRYDIYLKKIAGVLPRSLPGSAFVTSIIPGGVDARLAREVTPWHVGMVLLILILVGDTFQQ
jgi:hypothetical protein